MQFETEKAFFPALEAQLSFQEQIKQNQWCPTMDLLLLLSKDCHKLILLRLCGQKVWQYQTEDSILCFQWRPDGKIIACGMENGSFLFLDVESGQLLFQEDYQKPIERIFWFHNDQEFNDSLSKEFILPPLSVLPDSSFQIGNKEKGMSILCAVDQEQICHFKAFGIFYLGTFPLVDRHIEDLKLSSDLSTLFIMTRHADQYQLETVSTQWHQYLPQIYKVSQKANTIHQLLFYLSQSLDCCYKEYKQMSQLNQQQFLQMEQQMETSGCLVTEWLSLLATGCSSEGLQAYLTQLGLKGLGNWKNGMEGGYQSLKKLLFTLVQPCCERLVLEMTDLSGYGRWKEVFGHLGLEENLIQQLIQLVTSLMARVEELFLVLEKEQSHFSSFMQWLHVLIEKKEQKFDIQLVIQYLRESFQKDSLLIFFTQPKTNDMLEVSQMPKKTSTFSLPSSTQTFHYKSSLLELQSMIQLKFQQMLLNCSREIEKSFQTESILPLGNKKVFSFWSGYQEEMLSIQTIQMEDDSSLLLSCFQLDRQKKWNTNQNALKLTDLKSSELKIINSVFYSEREMIVLFTNQNHQVYFSFCDFDLETSEVVLKQVRSLRQGDKLWHVSPERRLTAIVSEQQYLMVYEMDRHEYEEDEDDNDDDEMEIE